MLDLNAYPALMLNADYRPLSTAPPSRLSWRKAVCAVLSDDVSVVANYDRVVSSPSWSMRLPSVVALRHYVDMEKPAPLTRYNLFLRDGHACAFCGERFDTKELTFDHVLPRSRGGTSLFENLVAACAPCNSRKRDRTPEEAGMPMAKAPWHPTLMELNVIGASLPLAEDVCADWRDWLYWNAPLER